MFLCYLCLTTLISYSFSASFFRSAFCLDKVVFWDCLYNSKQEKANLHTVTYNSIKCFSSNIPFSLSIWLEQKSHSNNKSLFFNSPSTRSCFVPSGLLLSVERCCLMCSSIIVKTAKTLSLMCHPVY